MPGTQDAERLPPLIEAAIEAGEAGALYVVPSTVSILRAVSAWSQGRGWQVIALREEFPPELRDALVLQSPAGYLAHCQHKDAAGPRRTTLVFTDQFVSSEHAPLLVRDGAQEMFHPTLELIAAARYGVPVRYWVDDAFIAADGQAATAEIAALMGLRRYYRSCDRLGDAWTQRSRQNQRSPAGRIDAARHRLRLYQSIVMLAPEQSLAGASRLPLLGQLISFQQRLPRVAGP